MSFLDLSPGFWDSEFSAAQAVAGLKEYGQLAVDKDGEHLYWVEYQPDQGGRNAICRCELASGEIRCLTPEGLSVRSSVHEYGGLSWCLLDQQFAFVNAADQQLWLQPVQGGQPQQLTRLPEARFGHPIWDWSRNRLIAVQELHEDQASPADVVNRLVAVALDSGEVTVLHEGADFYDGPVLSPDSSQLAWICWMHPAQPWTVTTLYHASVDAAGVLSTIKTLGNGDEALTQPKYAYDGSLHVISDREEWWQIYRVEDDELHPLAGQQTADHCAAPWQLGQSSYLLTQKGWIAGVHRNGNGALQQWQGSELRDLSSGYSHFRSLCQVDQRLYCIASSPARLPAVVEVDTDALSVRVITGGGAMLSGDGLSVPQTISFPVMNEQAHALFYPPANATVSSCEQPPLVVFLHGGPTSAAYPVFSPKVQYWTQRGFAVADLNYRGSTGFGRTYRMRLQTQWGVTDVEDAVALVEFLAEQGRINPQQVFIRGGSAGGFTALAALAASDCFTAGASLYGVTDLAALAVSTHKFESRYLDWLIGDPQAEQALYRERSPITVADKIHCPVIFFQGMQDRVVPPEQTEQMAKALKSNGNRVEVHRYADEYHGFRDPDVQQEVLEKELAFYRTLMASG